ncbi:MAG: hypothetical protein ACI4CS_00080 [Candidatus Weimeria sp.]
MYDFQNGPIGYQTKKTYLTKEDVKRVRRMTPEKCLEVTKRDCIYCEYSSGGCSSAAMGVTCNYILDEGHRRPCFPGDCREAGVFKKRQYDLKLEDNSKHFS